MIYLVTGGAGFIGSHLVEALVKKGQRVRVLDNFSTGKRSNLDEVMQRCGIGEQDPRLTVIEGDIRDRAVCEAAVRDADYVLHQAALSSPSRSVADPLGTTAVNVTGTLNLLWAAKEANVKRVVFASSSAVYGDTPVLPKVESLPPHPQSPYAVSKVAGEHFCRVFYRSYGLPTVALRYFKVYGPRQDAESQDAAVVPRFVSALRAGQPVTIYGDGKQSRDFTFIDDCVRANLLACRSRYAVGEVMNVASGGRTTINDLYREIARLLHVSVKPDYAEARPGDVNHSLADLHRAGALLGYRPKVDIKTGLKHLIAALRPVSAVGRLQGNVRFDGESSRYQGDSFSP
ncbi:MAG: SDR family oxidoreductase [Nitrospirae bacterium]|nr:SDR family oxidoreductase [Nitrospirota bacterium]